MRTHCFRLRRGQDLLKEIQAYAEKEHIGAAVVLSASGCVLKGRVRDAGGVTVRDIGENMEIVSLTGTVSEQRTHLHVSFAKENLSVVGGHLTEGCTVNTTAEIVLLELGDVRFSSSYDDETGYDELGVEDCR